MTFLDRLEKYVGWITIHSLPVYIVTAQAVIYLWGFINPGGAQSLLLDPIAIRYGGEYWRALTFLFVIPQQNPIFAFFFLYILYIYGSALEAEWGSFPFTLFYLVGVIGTLVAAFLFGSVDGAFFINTTIFLAFAAVHPDMELLIFFIIPVKVKWLAMITWAWLAYILWGAPRETQIAILISISNYFLFFSKTHLNQVLDWIRRKHHQRRMKDFQ